MKKEYRKPSCYLESFTLANHISAGCLTIANFGSSCPVQDGPVVFFTSTENGCNEDGMSMFTFAGVDPATATIDDLINLVQPKCYNSFTDYNTLFVS